MGDGFPVPDFDFEDSPLIPIGQIHHFTPNLSVPSNLNSVCTELGFSINADKPLRFTANSMVYSSVQISTGIVYALKISKFKNRISHEYKKRKELPDNIYLVKSYAMFELSQFAILQLEFCEGGDLCQWNLPEEYIWQLIHDIGHAIACIHQNGWIHLDISPSNILYNGEIFKLADFGTLIQVGTFQSGMEGAGPYVSPETMADPDSVGAPADIFSFGVVLLEICSGFYAPRGGEEKYAQLRRGEIKLGGERYRSSCSPKLVDLVNLMLSPDQKQRPSALEIINHPMVASIDRQTKAEE